MSTRTDSVKPRWPKPKSWPQGSQFIGRSDDGRYDLWVCAGGGVGIRSVDYLSKSYRGGQDKMIHAGHRNGTVPDSLMDFMWFESTYYEAAREAHRLGIEGFEWLTDEYHQGAKERAIKAGRKL